MRLFAVIGWVFRGLLFVALLLFAAKNVDPVTLHFYLDQSWRAPLILVLVAFFGLGAALGVIACLSKLFAQRREIQALRRRLRDAPPAEHSRAQVPPDMGA